jgi:hypothetical protein
MYPKTFMSRKENGNPAAIALVNVRWDRTPKKRRSDHARRMAKARWDAYYKAHPEKLKAKLERSKSKKKTAKEAD